MLQNYTYASGIYPAHQVKVRSAVEMQARSRDNVLQSAKLNCTAQWKQGFSVLIYETDCLGWVLLEKDICNLHETLG